MSFKEKPKLSLESFADMMDFDVKPSTEQVNEFSLDEMKTFPDHKFKLYEGQQLEDMVQSIKEYGVMLPIILWHKDNEYIILSGHNRRNAAMLAGLKKAPVIVKENLTHEEAVLIVTETNLRQRSFTDLTHSERAYCLAEHYEAMKKQGKRNDILNEINSLLNTDEMGDCETSSPVGTKLRSNEKVGKEYNLSRNSVARYIRIATIEKNMMDLLDQNKIGVRVAYQISFITDQDVQLYIFKLIEKHNFTLDMKKAEMLRSYFEDNKLTILTAEEILDGTLFKKPKNVKPKDVKLKRKVIDQYFVNGESEKEIAEIIVEALEQYFS